MKLSRALQLQCPKCNRTYLTHGTVEVWNRDREDSSGSFTRVEPDRKVRSESVDVGFIGRRSDVRISFQCESCGDVGQLSIVEHKGHTLVCWSDESPPTFAVG